jgi:hypothetical protein
VKVNAQKQKTQIKLKKKLGDWAAMSATSSRSTQRRFMLSSLMPVNNSAYLGARITELKHILIVRTSIEMDGDDHHTAHTVVE